MDILTIIGGLIILGVLLWAVQAMPFIDAGIKKLIYILIVVAIVIWLVSAIFPGVRGVRVGYLGAPWSTIQRG